MDAAERDKQVRNFVKEVWNSQRYEAAAELYGEKYVNPFGTGPSAKSRANPPTLARASRTCTSMLTN